MDLILGKGFEIKDGVASIPAAELSDDQITNNLSELRAEAEARGLSVPEGAGQLAVVQTVETPVDFRAQILANAKVDVEHTNRVFDIINDGRSKKNRFFVAAAGEHLERLEDQLTDEALTAAAQLYTAKKRPLMVVPPLPKAITVEELVTAIDKSSKRGIYGWDGRLDFLKKFPVDVLTGFDAERAESGALTLVETSYDVSRQGTRDQQFAGLQADREEFPEIGTAPILTTASLAQRYGGVHGQPDSWQDTYTRAIEVDPVEFGDSDCVVLAHVFDVGYADLYASSVRLEGASRRQVRLEA